MMARRAILRNQQGSIVITTMVILSIVIVIMSGVVTMKLTELSKQAFKVNESYRYLNVMEEMGMLIARSRQLARAGACPTGTYAETVGATNFCLPSSDASGSMQSACIVDTSQKDRSGNSIKYCLMPSASSGLSVSSLEKNFDKTERIAGFNVVEVHEKSMIEKVFTAMFSVELPAAYAVGEDNCDLNQTWARPCSPVNSNTGSYSGVSFNPSVVVAPGAYSTAPTGTGSASSLSYATRGNMEPWTPSISSWTPGGTNNANEIYTPSCDVSTSGLENQAWLGCMSCSDANVLCVDIRMCPPVYATGTASCSQPYRQRIAIYPDTGI